MNMKRDCAHSCEGMCAASARDNSNQFWDIIPRARARRRLRERNLTPARADYPVHGSFSTLLKSFWCKTAQFCVTRRECQMAETPSVDNGAQADENPRKNSLLNYETVALSTEK
jgi:hypothetical protein